MSSCIEHFMDERDMDEESAGALCQSLKEEEKAEAGDADALLEAIEDGAGLIADVGVDLVSGVDVPAVDSKWVAMKAEGDSHDWRADVPVLLSKADDDSEDQRISYAAAMIPREPDKEGDVVPTATVESAAHDFLKSDGGIDTDHSLIDGEGDPVESWVLKEDRTFDLPDDGTETYAAGTWMLGVEWGADAWERIKAGELTGLSIYGMAEHVPLERSADEDVTRREILEAINNQGAEDETPDTHKEDGTESGDMGDEQSDSGGEETGPTLDDLSASVADLEASITEIKDAIETDKADGDLQAILEEFSERVASLDDVDLDPAQARDNLKTAFSAQLGEEDKADDEDEEMDDDEEEEEEEKADDVEKRTEEANMSKGYDGEGTREATLDDDGGSDNPLSYESLAKAHEEDE